jgi:NAD(P)-dependent dehydrogenase (short-subunit alcohol dehydrogenase family)
LAVLAGKVVAVTGGGRGIGREVALLCAREGASVIVNDPGGAQDGCGVDVAPAEQTVLDITDAGGKAAANFASIVDPAGAASVIEQAVSRCGRIDGVINTAGILRDAIWHKLSLEDWRAVIDVHLNGSFNICKAATPHFREQRSGSFVLFTSNAGLTGNVGQANYAAAKLGVLGLSQSIALDAARYGVRANCIAPVAYNRMIASLNPQAAAPQSEAMSAAKIAPLAAYLVSDAAQQVTNQVFGVRGNEITLYAKPRPLRTIARSDGWSVQTIADELIPALRSDFERADQTAADLFPYDPI